MNTQKKKWYIRHPSKWNEILCLRQCGARFYIRDENLQCLRAVIEREFTFFHFALLFFEKCECIQVLVRRICTCTRLLEYDSNLGRRFDMKKKKNWSVEHAAISISIPIFFLASFRFRNDMFAFCASMCSFFNGFQCEFYRPPMNKHLATLEHSELRGYECHRKHEIWLF